MNYLLTVLALAVVGTAFVGLCAFIISGRLSRMEEEAQRKQLMEEARRCEFRNAADLSAKECDKRHRTWRDS